jgi:hypothetical protein
LTRRIVVRRVRASESGGSAGPAFKGFMGRGPMDSRRGPLLVFGFTGITFPLLGFELAFLFTIIYLFIYFIANFFIRYARQRLRNT